MHVLDQSFIVYDNVSNILLLSNSMSSYHHGTLQYTVVIMYMHTCNKCMNIHYFRNNTVIKKPTFVVQILYK